MEYNMNIPWEKIYDFILSCSSAHELKAFSIKVLTGLQNLCQFDQSLVYFLDGNRKVTNQYLMNIDKQWSSLYLEYYSKTDSGRYRLDKDLREKPEKPTISIISWEKEPSAEFVPEYIHSRGIKYSLGFPLFDLNGMPRTVFSLDKTKNENFKDDECNIVYLLLPILNNLHKNFFSQQTSRKTINQTPWETTNLTPREVEIANMLCQGLTPETISKSLYISKSTTYKHISNIYKKMQVSSKQELILRLMG